MDAVLQMARDNNLMHLDDHLPSTLPQVPHGGQGPALGRNGWPAVQGRAQHRVVMTPEAKPEFVPILRELAAGLREGDGGRHLITFKPDPSPYSSSFLHDENWLDFDSIQTWNAVKLIYPMVTYDYHLKPVKPVLMAEGAYEAGSEYGFDVTPAVGPPAGLLLVSRRRPPCLWA